MTRGCALAVTVVAALGLAACRVTPPHATAMDAQRSGIALAELKQGRALMVTKCGNCHKPPLPNAHPAHAWPAMLDEMSERSSLTPDQRRLIQQYFVAMAPG